MSHAKTRVQVVQVGHEEVVERALVVLGRFPRGHALGDGAHAGIVVRVEEESQRGPLHRRVDDAVRRGDEVVVGHAVEHLPGVDDQRVLHVAHLEPLLLRRHHLQARHRRHRQQGEEAAVRMRGQRVLALLQLLLGVIVGAALVVLGRLEHRIEVLGLQAQGARDFGSRFAGR